MLDEEIINYLSDLDSSIDNRMRLDHIHCITLKDIENIYVELRYYSKQHHWSDYDETIPAGTIEIFYQSTKSYQTGSENIFYTFPNADTMQEEQFFQLQCIQDCGIVHFSTLKFLLEVFDKYHDTARPAR